MTQRSSPRTRGILGWPDENITVQLDSSVVITRQLAPRLQRRRDIEWLGIIHRERGDCGAIGRLRATGKLVEVFGRSISTLQPQIAAAVSAALDAEIRGILQAQGTNDWDPVDRRVPEQRADT